MNVLAALVAVMVVAGARDSFAAPVVASACQFEGWSNSSGVYVPP